MDHNFLPSDSQERKNIPVYSGFVAYFPRAMAAVAANLERELEDESRWNHWYLYVYTPIRYTGI
jgi:hypothetical protein